MDSSEQVWSAAMAIGKMFLYIVGEATWQVFLAVIATLILVFFVEPKYKRAKQRKELDKISWLFPISGDHPEMHFKLSLKPAAQFRVASKDGDVFNEFFGRNPPTYRRYVHSAEVLALQQITEKLSPLGVHFICSGFYGGDEGTGNLLLIGSGANTEMSATILSDLGRRIGYEMPPEGGHRYFICGARKYCCKHSEESGGLRKVTSDYGVIVRRTFSDGRMVLLLAGIHMHGTLAAAQVALNPAFQQRVLKYRYSNFAQLVRVKVLDNGVSIDGNSLESWRKLPFIDLG